MHDNKESKESKRRSKIAVGIVATSNRLETTKAVLNSLKTLENQRELLFLKDVAALALAILTTIQEIEDGDIDDNFLALALDSCGLVYLVIDQCEEESKRDGDIFDQMKVDSGELARNLREISEFVEKKVNRKFFKRIVKHSTDDQKVVNYRDGLRKWMKKFGKLGDSSIHDALQEAIDLKVHRREQIEVRSKEEIASLNLCDATRNAESLSTITPTFPNFKPIHSTAPEQYPVYVSVRVNDSNRTHTLLDEQNSSKVQLAVDDEEEKEMRRIAAEARKKKRLDDDAARKRAESERWQKAKQEFIQLPEASANEIEKEIPRGTSSSSVAKPLPVIEVESESESESEPKTSRLPGPMYREKKSRSRLDDEQIAAALHAKLQKELEEEDEEAAIVEAAKLQREWEAEEGRKSRRARPKKKKTRRSPTNSSIDDSLSGEIESLRFEESHGTENSPDYYSPSPETSWAEGASYRGRSTSPHGNELPYVYPLLPHPYHPSHPPLLPPPSTSLNNIAYSAISLGGGPVNVSNHNVGNIHTTTITDSMNDYSVNYYK